MTYARLGLSRQALTLLEQRSHSVLGDIARALGV